jgi:hypothetical protein
MRLNRSQNLEADESHEGPQELLDKSTKNNTYSLSRLLPTELPAIVIPPHRSHYPTMHLPKNGSQRRPQQ